MQSSQTSPLVPDGTIEERAPWNQHDSCKAFQCSVCGKRGYEEYRGAERFLDRLDSDLTEAGYTPNRNWVCSKVCRSQLMFESSTEEQQYALQQVQKALLDIYEHLPRAQSQMDTWLDEPALLDLAKNTRAALDAIAFFDDPNWIQENCADKEAALVGHVSRVMRRVVNGGAQ